MDDVTLIYFEGCPEAKNLRAVLLTAGIYDFKVIIQNELSNGDRFRKLSSPSILFNEELIYGIHTTGEVATCTFDYQNTVDESSLVKRLKELRINKIDTNLNVRSMLGTGFSALLVLKCPACIPGLVAFLSTVGLSFIVTLPILKSILVGMLLLTLSGFLISYVKSHRNIIPLLLGAVFSLALYTGHFHSFETFNGRILVYAAILGLLCTSFWDLKLKSQKKCSACA